MPKGKKKIKKKFVKKPKLATAHITMILDRSGSMGIVQSDVIGGVNTFVKDQKKVPGKCTLTMVQFDSINPYEVLQDCQELSKVSDTVLTPENYIPRGSTPLFDAIGRGIVNTAAAIAKLTDKPERVYFVIQTDGQENSSAEYNLQRIQTLIKEYTDQHKWNFVFLGANIDAVAVGGNLGISKGSTMSNAHGAAGYSNAFRSTSSLLSASRESKTSCSLNYSDEDRKAAMES